MYISLFAGQMIYISFWTFINLNRKLIKVSIKEKDENVAKIVDFLFEVETFWILGSARKVSR